jgi:ADP-heptose:LPS heptosyltransferase
MEAGLSARGVPTLRLQGSTDLVVLAALLQQCRALITGDTGPMHLAAAVGTPVLAVFGPSMPWRYGPLVEPNRVVRVDLPCSPCNRIRLPPLRCQGHTPDCLAEVRVDAVVAAGRSLLASIVLSATAGTR